MGYIYGIRSNSETHLIEPFLYAEATGNSIGYIVSIPNYVITTGTIIFIKVPTNNADDVTLKINSGTTIPIYYQSAALTAGMLTAGYTYALTYDGTVWNVLNNLQQASVITIDSTGGLENGARGLKIKDSGIVNAMITDGTIANGKLAHSSITIAGNEVALGGSISLSDLGLTSVLHFKGFAVNNSLTEGSKLNPFISSNSPPLYNGEPGDVVIDQNKEYEYVWIDSSEGWERLGGNNTYKIVQTAVSDPTASGATDAFIDSISQNENGAITVTKKYVSGWQFPRKVYTDLTTASTNITINGDNENASAVGIGIDGVLGVNNGGTGADEYGWTAGGILYGKLNQSTKYYTSIAGSQYQILTSGGTGDPVWATAALLESVVNNTPNAQNYTTLELGNDVDITRTNSGHSEGRLILYSASTEAHILRGLSTTIGYTHMLPNSDGYILQSENAGAVGSNTQPIYIAANGIATALTYTPNRLYYSDAIQTGQTDSTSFIPGNYFADGNKLGINLTSWPASNTNPLTDVLYVNGGTLIEGVLKILDTTDISVNSGGALIVAGGVTIDKKLYVDESVTFNDTLDVAGASTLIGKVGIGAAPSASNYILYVNGTSLFEGHIYPESDDTYDLGLNDGSELRWRNLYLSNSLLITNSTATASIELLKTGVATITAASPQIIFNTTVTGPNVSDWVMQNDEGILYITDDTSTQLKASSHGFSLYPKVNINEDIDNVYTYNFYVNGTSGFSDNLTFLYNNNETMIIDVSVPSIYPYTTGSGTLGQTSNRWGAVYIGSANSYGDLYAPIYWNNGVPAPVVITQKINFTLENTDKSVTISVNSTDVFTTDSIVTQIVVTGGFDYLTAPLTWKSGSGFIAINTSVAVTGTVTGYILVIRGEERANSNFAYSHSSTEV